jgi:hypothetical protein
LRDFLPKALLGNAKLRPVILVALAASVLQISIARAVAYSLPGFWNHDGIALGKGCASGDGPLAGGAASVAIVVVICAILSALVRRHLLDRFGMLRA